MASWFYHSKANTNKFTQQCNVVPYFYAVYWLRKKETEFHNLNHLYAGRRAQGNIAYGKRPPPPQIHLSLHVLSSHVELALITKLTSLH